MILYRCLQVLKMIFELLSESAMRKATTTATTPESVKTQENQPVPKHVEITYLTKYRLNIYI